MPEYGIRIMDAPPALRRVADPVGEWIEWFDYDKHAPGRPYPTGDGGTTKDPQLALRFPTAVDAWAAWKRESHVTPLRPDGQPNRPMTIFTVEVSRLPEQESQDAAAGDRSRSAAAEG